MASILKIVSAIAGLACLWAQPVPSQAQTGRSAEAAPAALPAAAPAGASPQRPAAIQVFLQGVLPGGKAVLSINGGSSQVMSSGQVVDGVKLLSSDGDSATVEVGGRRERILLGAAPYRGRAPETGNAAVAAETTGKAVLAADSRGHFITTGYINGKPQQFLVDTGASIVALSSFDAYRLGLNLKNARTVQANTANGATYGLAIKLDSLKIGDIVVNNVEAWVLDNLAGPALLGNTFLNRLSMTREAGTLVLTKRF